MIYPTPATTGPSVQADLSLTESLDNGDAPGAILELKLASKRTHVNALMEPRTFTLRELPSRSCSRLNLQALRTRVRTNSELCQNTSHCLAHSIPACTAGSALWIKPMAILDVTHLPDLGNTASAARNRVPCMVEGRDTHARRSRS